MRTARAVREVTADWRPDPDQHLSLLFDVFALGQQVRTLVALAMAGCELRPDEYAAYSVVFEAAPVTMTEMARQLGMPVTTAADFVRGMRSRGHVRREPHPQDSRAYLLSLTAAGLRAHRAASAAFEAAHRALLDRIAPGPDRDATVARLRSTLQRLTESARAGSASLAAAPLRARRT